MRETAEDNTDLNGDDDATDFVLHIYDASTGTITNVGLAVDAIELDGNFVAFLFFEEHQGNTDRNGDGDASDAVLHIYDASTCTTTNLGLALRSRFFSLAGNLLAFRVSEKHQGNTDLNGDGDVGFQEDVLHVHGGGPRGNN